MAAYLAEVDGAEPVLEGPALEVFVPCLLLVCVAATILSQAVIAARSCKTAAPPEGSEEGGLDAEDSAGAGATASTASAALFCAELPRPK